MKERSNEPELMDDLSLPVSELQLALDDITTVNRYLGGNKATLDAVYNKLRSLPGGKRYTIVDIGCGDGALLRKLAEFLDKHNVEVDLIGIDINAKSLARGRELSQNYRNISFEEQDILELSSVDTQWDLVLCNLTIHHFTNREIVVFVKKFFEMCRYGVIINDLHRSSIAYQLFKLFSSVFFRSSVAKHDGLVSIQRGFKKEELQLYAKQAELSNYSIHWRWAFRYLWVIHKSAEDKR